MKLNIRLSITIIITVVYFIIHFIIANDYGLSWDYHYHNYAGRFHIGLPIPSIQDPAPVPFSPPDPRLTVEDPFGPFTQIIPSFSQYLFYERLHILPFDTAYDLPMIVFGALGVGLVFYLLSDIVGLAAGFAGAAFLGLMPVYFGYLHNDMKDIPNAFAFSLAVYCFWKLEMKRNLRTLLLAILSFAFAFNVKINSIMIPVVCGVWFLMIHRTELIGIIRGKLHSIINNRLWIVVVYFITAPVAAVLMWLPFWKDPFGKLLELPYFYSNNTINMPVLLFGNIFRSGFNIPPYYPYVYLGITIPLPILIFFVIGIVYASQTLRRGNRFSLLLLLWFFIPILRYLSPKAGAIDGVRHFMEIVYPLSMISALGVYWLFHKFFLRKKLLIFGIVISCITVGMLILEDVYYHPYQTSYFNPFIGGIRGAWGKFDIDFWGTPQKEAISWLNANVPPNSSVYIVMAQSTAATYLRPDLLKYVNTKSIAESDYVVVLNRETFFTVYDVSNYITGKTIHKPVAFERTIDGVPLVWVFKNR